MGIRKALRALSAAAGVVVEVIGALFGIGPREPWRDYDERDADAPRPVRTAGWRLVLLLILLVVLILVSIPMVLVRR